MEKPLSVRIDEMTAKIADVINDSGVPLYVADRYIEGILSEVKSKAIKQMEVERSEYNKSSKGDKKDAGLGKVIQQSKLAEQAESDNSAK